MGEAVGMVNTDPRNLLPDIIDFVDDLQSSLWDLNLYLHENPELAFEEHKAHAALTGYMTEHSDWKVCRSAYGMETAWSASYNSGNAGPVVSFNAEMGHACGHNLIAIASVAAGLATARVMQRHNLRGRVIIFGTPGEEGYGGGKKRLLEAGAYNDVDVSLISHPGILNNSPMVRTTAFTKLEVKYFGQAAHAARSPWLGINALDALVVAYNAISVLRQQTMPSDVIGIHITNGGTAPNIIHAFAAGTCVIRAATAPRLKELQDKIEACFRAGSQATGARAEISVVEGYADNIPNSVLAASYTKYWNAISDIPDPPIPPPGQFTFVKASTDQGNISYVLPSINCSFAIPPGEKKGQPHSPDFEKASGTKTAFERALRVGKAMAGAAIDVLSIPGLLSRIQEQWERDMAAVREQRFDQRCTPQT